jgi:predicted esterase
MPETNHKLFHMPFKIAICFIVSLHVYACGSAQTEKISSSLEKQSFIYAVKDSIELGLDVYHLKGFDSTSKKPCVIFVFGGAFVGGRRDDSLYNQYFNSLVENNYILVSISYRLGLKGVKNLSVFHVEPLKNAIDMAVDDVYDATNWVIAHADSLGIDSSKIILSGSSSGAITVLESDYKRRNEDPSSNKLPAHFEYAGVISFSGAILSFDWGVRYQLPPAPTLMFHGTADKIVPYNKIGFLNKGMYGSAWLAKIFKEKNYPYYFYCEEGMGHEIAVLPMFDNIPVILDFLDRFVIQLKPLQISVDFKNPEAKPRMLLTSKELFEKLQHS